jgi:hypothetical protein
MDKGDLGWRVAGGAAALAAGMLARKVITFSWERATGKAPPDNPESPDVAIGEALGWAIVAGVGMEVARVLAARAVARQWQRRTGELPSALRRV